ncbi:hypothetical protein EI94DRAFT_1716956 [Lactarius quietus]|nr:hypothetical protein EI94DRAFT_1716956 [Lactarius quietus]
MPHTSTDNIIDQIFAGSAPLKKHRKRKIKHSQSQPVEPKSPAPEIVHDPSSQPPHSSHTTRRTAPSSKKRKLVEKLDQDKFDDSRGTGPRRKTEEDELGINVEAGGTPLCPFDCNCCERLAFITCQHLIWDVRF